MDEWIIYPSINNSNRYALGSPDGRELERGETVEILLGGFRIPGFIEYSPNGDYFMAMPGQSICGLYAGMKVYLAHTQVAVLCRAGAPQPCREERRRRMEDRASTHASI
jgi:hypothetical protein